MGERNLPFFVMLNTLDRIDISQMKINLWYCVEMNQWRWTLTDDRRPISKQESGQQSDLRMAMNDVANTVEYMLECSQPE